MNRQGMTTEEDIRKMKLEIYNAENNIVDHKKKKFNKKRIIDIVVMSALCVLTLIFVLRATSQRADGEPVDVFGVYFFSVETESMVPTLLVNDVFASKKINDNTEIKIGDIITFKNPNGDRVTHRVVDIILVDGVTKYKTKGDSKYNGIDSWALVRSDIEGIFWFKFPSIKGALNGK
ncbi:MAG: signal peptidase I [Clostridia bacterium]